MILGIGCDIVEISRFIPWCTYADTKLLQVFSMQEIQDAHTRNTPQDRAAFYASRFAAKEAFYKALCNALYTLGHTPVLSFAQVRSAVEVHSYTWGGTKLQIAWPELCEKTKMLQNDALSIAFETIVQHSRVHLTLSHEQSHTIAFVVIERATD